MKPLSASQKRAIRRLWVGELTTEEVALEMEMTGDELAEAAKSLGLPERGEPNVYIPTPLEIRLASADIRSKWTPQEREERLKAAHSVRASSARMKDTGQHNEEANSRGAPGLHRDLGKARSKGRRRDRGARHLRRKGK